jgi:preprotein translocase subunit SecF
MVMNFLRFFKLYIGLFVVAVVLSVVAVFAFGLDLGIELQGGSIEEVNFLQERPQVQEIRDMLSAIDLGSYTVQETGDSGVLLRMKDISEETHQAVLSALGENAQELRFESIGPVIGKELQEKTFVLALVALVVIVGYIMFAFRKVPFAVRPWHWSVVALLVLACNLIVVLGLLALLGNKTGLQITIPVVVALLTVLGYSINDTVVVFDRIRENLAQPGNFQKLLEQSIRQVLARSLGTSFTTILVLAAIFLYGGETLGSFSLVLMMGIGIGTMASLLLVPSLLLVIRPNIDRIL